MEDTKIGTVIHTLVALDPDVNTSEALNYAATEPITAIDKYGNEVADSDSYKDFFSVDKNTGKVTVATKLQRDVAAVVTITVLVTDITAPTVQQGQGEFFLFVLFWNSCIWSLFSIDSLCSTRIYFLWYSFWPCISINILLYL